MRPGTHGDLLVAAAPVTHGEEVIGAVLVAAERTDVLGEVALVWAGLAAAAVTIAPKGRTAPFRRPAQSETL